ncbi:MAG: transposase [Enterocloster clostridioformis]
MGGAKAAKELGIPEGTMHTWLKAVRAGKLDIGEGSHTPASAMSLSEEITMLRKRVKEQDKEIRRLKEENEFWRKPVLFSPPAVGSQQKPENDLSGFENRGRQDDRENFILLPDAWCQSARLL